MTIQQQEELLSAVRKQCLAAIKFGLAAKNNVSTNEVVSIANNEYLESINATAAIITNITDTTVENPTLQDLVDFEPEVEH